MLRRVLRQIGSAAGQPGFQLELPQPLAVAALLAVAQLSSTDAIMR